jgi:hypothetical protein
VAFEAFGCRYCAWLGPTYYLFHFFHYTPDRTVSCFSCFPWHTAICSLLTAVSCAPRILSYHVVMSILNISTFSSPLCVATYHFSFTKQPTTYHISSWHSVTNSMYHIRQTSSGAGPVSAPLSSLESGIGWNGGCGGRQYLMHRKITYVQSTRSLLPMIPSKTVTLKRA